jgi:hypothetical protein
LSTTIKENNLGVVIEYPPKFIKKGVNRGEEGGKMVFGTIDFSLLAKQVKA